MHCRMQRLQKRIDGLLLVTLLWQRYKRKGIGNEIFTKFLREAFRVISFLGNLL